MIFHDHCISFYIKILELINLIKMTNKYFLIRK